MHGLGAMLTGLMPARAPAMVCRAVERASGAAEWLKTS